MKLDKKLALEVFDAINELRDAHIKNNVKFESQYKRLINNILKNTNLELIADTKEIYKIVLKTTLDKIVKK